MHSINTILLQTFARLIVCGRSFSVGDVVFYDPKHELFQELMRQTNRIRQVYADTWEMKLAVPLTVQCKCPNCLVKAVPKTAITFRVLKDVYLLVCLHEHPPTSLAGMMERARVGLLGDPHTVPGCPVRSADAIPYVYALADEETIACATPRKKFQAAMRSFREYNNAARIGCEFFVPQELYEDDRLYN